MLSHVWLFCDPMDCSPPVSSSTGLPSQEYWSGLPFLSPGDLLDPGIQTTSPALCYQGSPRRLKNVKLFLWRGKTNSKYNKKLKEFLKYRKQIIPELKILDYKQTWPTCFRHKAEGNRKESSCFYTPGILEASENPVLILATPDSGSQFYAAKYPVIPQVHTVPQSVQEGFPSGANDKEPACQCLRRKRWGFNPRKIPWRRAWQHTPVFLPGESHGQNGQKSLVGLQSMGSQRVGCNWKSV